MIATRLNPSVINMSDTGHSAAQLSILGDFSLAIRERPVCLGRAGTQTVALLAISGGMSRERMQAIVWPEANPELAAGRLRSLVYRIHQISSKKLIVTGPARIELSRAITVDFHVAAAAAAQLRHRDLLPPAQLPDIARSLERELLPMFSWEWLEPHQRAWTWTRLRALAACAQQAVDAADYGTAIDACEQVIAIEPYHEQAHYIMISALLHEGYERCARDVYDRLHEVLAKELNCSPRRTYRQLRSFAADELTGTRP